MQTTWEDRMLSRKSVALHECSSLHISGYETARKDPSVTSRVARSISSVWSVFHLHLRVMDVLPDGFFPVEFWRHQFKRVIRWRIRIYFIFKGHVVSPLVLEPEGGFQEKPGRALVSISSCMNRRRLNIGSATTFPPSTNSLHRALIPALTI